MAGNAFIQPFVQSVQPQVICPLFDPRPARAHRRRFFRDDIPELEYANSLYVPAGHWPSRGWLLVRRGDYNKITNLYANNFQLAIDDLNAETNPLVFKNLSIVQARCVSRGIAADPNAIYLIEVTDGEGCLWNPWTQFPVNTMYNVRAPAYPGQYHSGSLNAGNPWTWNTMIGDLWGRMTTFLGPYPHLPITPTGTPENFIFPGVPCWAAMTNTLDILGLTLSEDLTQASPYGIVVPGAADAVFAAKQAEFANLLDDDLEWIDAGSGRIPGQVVVYFHRRNQYYGTEETVRNDSLQWETNAVYSVTVASPALFSKATGTHHIWDDFTLQYDIDGNPLAADVATANTIAQERATQYYTRAYRGTLGFMRQTYIGTVPFASGSQVDGVRWVQDFRRGNFGWITEIIRGPQPPWEEVGIHMQVGRTD